MLIVAETLGDGVTFADRARWEATIRAGRSRRAGFNVAGWRDAAGALWRPNTRVSVKDPYLGIVRDMLIAGVTFTKDARGTLTRLETVRPGAFELIALEDQEEDGLWTP